MSDLSKSKQSVGAADRLIRVTLIGAVVDGLLGLLKIVVGVIGHSAALVADGVHSLSDLLTDGMVLWVGRVAYSQADAEHPYGHRRFETLGSMLLGAALILVAGVIVWEGGQLIWRQLWLKEVLEPISVWVVGAALLSAVAKEWVYRLTSAVGREIGSSLLEANAWHSRTDAISSLLVFLGVLFSYFELPWLDSVVALLLGGYIAFIGWRLLYKSVDELVDSRGLSQSETEEVMALVLGVPGVVGLHDLRSRQMGGEVLVDVHLEVAKIISVSEGHQLGERVVAKIREGFPTVREVTFHIDPEGIHQLKQDWPSREIIVQALAKVDSDIEGAIANVFKNPRRLELHYTGSAGATAQGENRHGHKDEHGEGVTLDCYYCLADIVELGVMEDGTAGWLGVRALESRWRKAVEDQHWPWLHRLNIHYRF